MKYKNRVDKHNIVIENTLYSLLVYWLRHKVNNTTYVLDTMIDDEVANRLSRENRVIKFDSALKKCNIYRAFYVFIYQKLKLYISIVSEVSKSDIYGSDRSPSFDLFRRYDYTLLEDGTGNYNLGGEKYNNLPIFKKYIRGYRHGKPFGVSKHCKKIYLTAMSSIPEIIADKVEVLDLKKLWELKSQKEKKEILELFGYTEDIYKLLKGRDIILLTQDLSEDNYISEKEKIDIYRKIIEQYDMKKILIKIHPREKTKYKQYFPDVAVIDRPLPFELLTVMGIKFKKAITLFSSAAFNLPAETELEWHGTSVHPKLEEKLGEMMKQISPTVAST